MAWWDPEEDDFQRVRDERAALDKDYELGRLSHAEWKREQQRLALADRKSFARESVRDNPLMAPSVASASLFDALLKGTTGAGRSGRMNPAPVLGSSLQGVGLGLFDTLMNNANPLMYRGRMGL